MIVIILFLIELAKWLAVALVVTFFVRIFVNSGLKKEISFLKVFFPVFVIVVASPFVYWQYRFIDFDKKYVDICEAETYAKINGAPPKSMIALQGEDTDNYNRFYSSSRLNWMFIERYQLDSLVIYDQREKTALDSIGGKWKKLTLVDKDSSECKFFDQHVKKAKLNHRQLPKDQCVTVEVLSDLDNVSFIDEVKTIDIIHKNSPFIVSLHRTKIVDNEKKEIFIDVQQVLADFPRFPNNFYAGFVSRSKRCEKAIELRRDKMVKGDATILNRCSNANELFSISMAA